MTKRDQPNEFLVRWNAQYASKPSTGFKRRKPLTQKQRDDAYEAVLARRAKMRY